VTVELGGGLLAINMPSGINMVRLYLGTNVSTGLYSYANGTGWGNFGAIPAGEYIIRYDATNTSIYYSQVFSWTGQSNLTVNPASMKSPIRPLIEFQSTYIPLTIKNSLRRLIY
jgi:hypothetical protein